ncbi:MAG: GIY-YIG nuclease family protein [Chromatiales bacterium]|jgi:putative endonuclease
MSTYFVYILTNQSNRVLYTGVTNNLIRRLEEHLHGHGAGFANKYRCRKLVYYEMSSSIESAIQREKQIKKGSRKRKIALVESMNPGWVDLLPTL